MKPSLRLPHASVVKTALVIIQLALSFGAPTIANGGGIGPSNTLVRSGLIHRTELPQGYLMVYSATDPFDDGGVSYYAHSAYSIYAIDGTLFKRIENHISQSDEIPTLVILPAGAYTIAARSESHGYVRVPILVTAGRQILIDPDDEQAGTRKRLTGVQHLQRMANK